MDLDSLGAGVGSMAYVNEGPKVGMGRLNRDVAGPWKPVGRVIGLVFPMLVQAERPI